MPFSHREFNAFIHENEFCRLLYDFLEDNQDQVLHKDNDDLLTILYEAYRISGGITSMAASGCHINDYIKYVRAKYEGMTNVILSTVWAILSLQSNIAQSLRPAVCTLHNVVDGDKFFRLINRFVSSVKRSERHLEILFPNDMLIIDSEAVSAEESMAQAHQAVESIKEKTDFSIQQTLIFPRVEQFNNNPDKVINLIKNK